MLRLSKKADYALIAMQRLAREGLLASHQGTRGGYQLSRPPSAISVADVIQAVDGPLTVTACSTEEENCEQYSKCSVRDPLWKIRERILVALQGCSITELARDTDAPIPITITRSPALHS